MVELDTRSAWRSRICYLKPECLECLGTWMFNSGKTKQASPVAEAGRITFSKFCDLRIKGKPMGGSIGGLVGEPNEYRKRAVPDYILYTGT